MAVYIIFRPIFKHYTISRKHIIRIIKYPQKPSEDLKDEIANMVKEDLKINLEGSDVVAIHRIPEKSGHGPIIAKVRNTKLKLEALKSLNLSPGQKKFF